MERPEKGGLKQLNSQKECGKIMTNPRWLKCPACGLGKVLKLIPGTSASNLVVYCKRCGKESIVNIALVPEP